MNGVGGKRQIFFNARATEASFSPGAIGQGGFNHRHPMDKGGYWLLFMRREGRWYEQQPIEPATFEYMVGQIKMSLVDGIKGPAEQADGMVFFRYRHVSGAGLARTIDNEFFGGQFF
jgi:hypothetical protein